MNLLGYEIGKQSFPLFVIAGPCVIESEKIAHEAAIELRKIKDKYNILLVYKSSFDKANRSSLEGYRGMGLEKGLRILETIGHEYDLPILTDVHEYTPIDEVSSVVSILQTPAFLCRQTDFIQRVARSHIPVNIKKGQFLSPEEMIHVVNKAKDTGNDSIMVCERGTSFGYNNLVSDMRSLSILRQTQCPVVFDATHSVQKPGALDGKSGGDRSMVSVLARAAIAVGIDGLFMETHPSPEEALSDGPNSWPLYQLDVLIESLLSIDRLVKQEQMLVL